MLCLLLNSEVRVAAGSEKYGIVLGDLLQEMRLHGKQNKKAAQLPAGCTFKLGYLG
jgi:hypothetical protein